MQNKHEWPLWLLIAWSHRNVKEYPGGDHNADILNFWMVTHQSFRTDETAWCAGFTGACLERSGVKSTRSAMARSYTNYGRNVMPADVLAPGTIGVQPRGSNPALGHVGFVVEDRGDKVLFISGNVSDRVTIDERRKSDFIAFRWPDAEADWGNFPVCYERTLAREWDGKEGFSDHPSDPGGPTFKGILAREFALWRGYADSYSEAKRMQRNPELIRELRAMTDRELKAIYAANYWFKSWADLMPVPLALMHFDCAVNQGVGDARKFVQYAVRTTQDGEIGPQTLHKANVADVATSVQRYRDRRESDYRSLKNWPVFGKGWINRINRIEKDAFALMQTGGQPAMNPDEIEHMSGDDRAPNTVEQERDHSKLPAPPKWWGKSLTIWGGLVSALMVVAPILPLFGVPLTAEMIGIIDEKVVTILQALGGIVGASMVVVGRNRATQPLSLADVKVRI